MRTALALLLLWQASPAAAFLFGGGSDKRAGELLASMRADYQAGDCQAVLGASDGFLAEKPPDAMREEAYGYTGSCYETCGSLDKAISLYKLALGLYPENVLFAGRLAAIYNRSGFPRLAAPLFARVLKAGPDDIDANLGLARAYAAQGFLARAKPYYSRAVILQDFRDAAALEEYARWMLRKGDWDEAVFIAGKGGQLQPSGYVWPLLQARAAAGRGDYYGAVSLTEAALKLSPSRRLRLERALYLLMGGLPRRAADAADAELAAGPDPLASMVKGMALYSQGRRSEAAPYLAAGRAAGPFTAEVADSLLGVRKQATEDACAK